MVGSWLIRWTSRRRRLAEKPTSRSAGRLCSRLPMPKSRVSLMVVSVRRADSFLVVLLDAGRLVVDVQRRDDAVGEDPGAEPARGRRRLAADDAPVEDQRDPVGAADVEVLADDLLEEHPPGQGPVQHLGEGELGLQDRDVVAVAGPAVRGGERVRQPGQPLAHEPVDLGRRPSRSQIRCSRVGSSQDANPLSSGSNPMPALAAWRLAHSLPLMHSLAL